MPRRLRISGLLGIALCVSVLADEPATAQAQAAWVWPLRGEVIAEYRNGSDPYAAGQHRGIDIAGDIGAPVIAAAGGEVRFTGTAGSSGLTVSVRTADGRFDTSYLHLSSTAVHEGQSIEPGARLGAVGTSGVRSTDRPHLHFGVRDAASRHAYRDPLSFLPLVPNAPARPRGAPAPAPAPLPRVPAPAPEPVRVPARPRIPASRRVPIRPRAPARPRVPIGPRVPAPVSLPRPVPAGVPARPPLLVADPGTSPRGERAAQGEPFGQRAVSAPGQAHVRRRAGGPAEALPGHAGPGRAGSPPAPGPDIGWALACAGLLLAAAILGLSEDGRKATRRGRDRLSGLLRPLAGRR